VKMGYAGGLGGWETVSRISSQVLYELSCMDGGWWMMEGLSLSYCSGVSTCPSKRTVTCYHQPYVVDEPPLGWETIRESKMDWFASIV
jgi:hypothetical protein